MEAASGIRRAARHRRLGLALSLLFHIGLAAGFLVVRLRMPEPAPVYLDLSLVDLRREAAPEQAPTVERPAPAEAPVEERTDEARMAERAAEARVRSRTGVREGLNWVAGEAWRPDPVPLEPGDRIGHSAGTLRRALVAGTAVLEQEPTAMDTLLFVQQRLAMIAEEALKSAREGAKGSRDFEPFPQAGSIQELRGGDVMPLIPLAGLVASRLAELGKRVWDRITNPDREAEGLPDMDLTYRQVLAFAALDDYERLNLFEWYTALQDDFNGGLGDLQQIAAQLSDRNLIALEVEGGAFVYRRLVPLRDVIGYYTSFLTRMRGGDDERREELIRKLAALARERGGP